MYCQQCGTQLPDKSNFCPKCGSNIAQAASTKTTLIKQKYNFNGLSMLILALCLISLVTMLVAPVINIPLGSEQKYLLQDAKVIGVENFITEDSLINTASPICFVFMLASLIAISLSLIFKKTLWALLASISNLIVFFTYYSSVSTWYRDMVDRLHGNAGDLTIASGGTILIIFSIAISILCVISIKREKNLQSA